MSQMVQNLALAALRLHPRNEEFFSNAEGEDFKRLKESIAEQGILTPLRVSSDMVIVSGHQRYRAAMELNMAQVPVIVDETLLDEDEKLAQLIASNFGRMKNDPVKQGRWIKEYERLRGVRRGGDRKSNAHNAHLITQEDIAKELGIDAATLRRLKQLNTLLPELQDIISEGRINATTGFKLIARLSEEEQQQLLEKLPATEKLTQKQVQEYVDTIHGLENKVAAAQKEVENMQQEAVDATNAIRAGSDSEMYLEMKRKMEDAQEALRKEHEAHNALKNNVRDANRKTAGEIKKLQEDLKKAQDKANAVPNVIEREIEIEVYPDDYNELKAKADKYDQLLQTNLQSAEIRSLSTPEEQQKQYELRFNQEVEGFVVELEYLYMEHDRIRSMSVEDHTLYAETLERIINIASEMLAIMNEKKEVA